MAGLRTSPALIAERFRSLPDTSVATNLAVIRENDQVLTEPDGTGGWRLGATELQRAGNDLEENFAPSLRPRTLVLLIKSCPYYLHRLAPADYARDGAVYAAYEKMWRDHGINCAVAGADFDDVDYSDRNHLTGSGGQKIAQMVAGYVERLNSP